jgi:hypothetical protein
MSTRKTYNWDEIREDFLNSNLSVEAFSKLNGFSKSSGHNHLNDIALKRSQMLLQRSKESDETSFIPLELSEPNEDEFIKLYERCTAAEARAEHFLEEFRIAMQKRYGRSSEKEISGQITIAEYMEKEFGTAFESTSEDENLPKDEKGVRELINQADSTAKSSIGTSL